MKCKHQIELSKLGSGVAEFGKGARGKCEGNPAAQHAVPVESRPGLYATRPVEGSLSGMVLLFLFSFLLFLLFLLSLDLNKHNVNPGLIWINTPWLVNFGGSPKQ